MPFSHACPFGSSCPGIAVYMLYGAQLPEFQLVASMCFKLIKTAGQLLLLCVIKWWLLC